MFLTFFAPPPPPLPSSNFYWHFLSISNRFWDIWLQSFQGLTLTFRGHLRSKIFPPFESPYMKSYLTSIDTFSLSCPVFEIFNFKVWVWMWMYTGIKVFLTFFCPSPSPLFPSNFYWHFLSISNRFWDIWLQSFQGLTLTFRGHLRSKIFPPFESPYMNSYLTSFDTFSLSCPVFEIFDFKVWVWMWMYTRIKVFLTFFAPPPSPSPLPFK